MSWDIYSWLDDSKNDIFSEKFNFELPKRNGHDSLADYVVKEACERDTSLFFADMPWVDYADSYW